ncbi:MAG: hypothetical protein ACXWCR_10410 [Flavitalea sp.]
MKKLTLLLCGVLMFCIGFTQNMILHDPVSAKVFNPIKYSEVRGTPFLFDKWMKGSVNIPRGSYADMQLKYDVYENIVYFNRDDQSYEFQEPVLSFILMPVPGDSSSYLYFTKGIRAQGLKENQFVQVLSEGKISLYKSDIKLLSELNEINRGVVQSFSKASRYFALKNNSIGLIKLNKNEVMTLVGDKEKQVSAFISSYNLSFKKEQDVIAIIDYYNSL